MSTTATHVLSTRNLLKFQADCLTIPARDSDAMSMTSIESGYSATTDLTITSSVMESASEEPIYVQEVSDSEAPSRSPSRYPSRRPTESTPAPTPTRSPTVAPTRVAPSDQARLLDDVPPFAVNSYQFFDTLENAESKNVMIAISCNKKNKAVMTPETAKQLIKYAAGFTTGNICVFIADEVMKYNHMAGGCSKRVALERSLEIGDYFEGLWKNAFAELPEEISSRGAVYRCADLYTEDHLNKFDETKRTMAEDFQLNNETYNAAAQLLRWRCPMYSVKAKRVKQILNFMYNEIPMLGLWRPMVLGGVQYEAMIYPATNPRGMSVVARASANFDAVFGPSKRFLRVFHMKHENTDKASGEADVQKFFDAAFLNHNKYN